jgi:hypothetical protein
LDSRGGFARGGCFVKTHRWPSIVFTAFKRLRP